MNSYQKLKSENRLLKKYLDILVNRPDSPEAIQISFNYKLKKQTEDAIMFGTPTGMKESPAKEANIQ